MGKATRVLRAGWAATFLCWSTVAAAQPSTMADEANTAAEEVRGLEAKLDRLVGEIRAGIPQDAAVRLQRLQRQWKAFARADCLWERAFADGGSVAPLVYAGCMKQQLLERITRLKPILCEGAGATGGTCEAASKY